MASKINLHVINEHGEHISEMNMRVDYGDEVQVVLIVLRDPDSECEHGKPYMEALNECMADQLAMQEGYDA